MNAVSNPVLGNSVALICWNQTNRFLVIKINHNKSMATFGPHDINLCLIIHLLTVPMQFSPLSCIVLS